MIDSDPERLRSLWRAILLQVVMDAMRDRPSDPTRERVACHEARMWLEKPTEDFLTVCSNAEVDPRRVAAWWKRFKENPNPPKNVMDLMASLGVYRVRRHGGRPNEQVAA